MKKEEPQKIWCADQLRHEQTRFLLYSSIACVEKIKAIRKEFNIPERGLTLGFEISDLRKQFTIGYFNEHLVGDQEFLNIGKLSENKKTQKESEELWHEYTLKHPAWRWGTLIDDLIAMARPKPELVCHIEELVLCDGLPLLMAWGCPHITVPQTKPYGLSFVRKKKIVRIDFFSPLNEADWKLLQKEVVDFQEAFGIEKMNAKYRNFDLYQRILLASEKEILEKGRRTVKQLHDAFYPRKDGGGFEKFKKDLSRAKELKRKLRRDA